MLLEEVQEPGSTPLRDELKIINRTAAQMMAQINEALDPLKIQATLANPLAFERRLRRQTSQIVGAAENLLRASLPQPDDLFRSDISRIIGAAHQAEQLARASLGFLSHSASIPITMHGPAAQSETDFLPAHLDVASDLQARKDSSILVVDDLEENRELLLRRLSRLGYAVQLVDNGQS